MKTLRRNSIAVATLLLGALSFATGVSAQTASAPTTKGQAQIVLLNLRLRGFEPSTATATAGKIFLVVTNHTGRPQLNLHVLPNLGPGLGQALASLADFLWKPTKGSTSMLLTLPAGSYSIADSTEPKWNCTLTVQ
jgi:hypothetical protein